MVAFWVLLGLYFHTLWRLAVPCSSHKAFGPCFIFRHPSCLSLPFLLVPFYFLGSVAHGADAWLPSEKKQCLCVSRWYPVKSSFCPAVAFKGTQQTVAFDYCAQSSTLTVLCTWYKYNLWCWHQHRYKFNFNNFIGFFFSLKSTCETEAFYKILRNVLGWLFLLKFYWLL